jgi:hypothetical protein
MDAKIQLQSSQMSRQDGLAEEGCGVGIFKRKETRIQYTDPAGACAVPGTGYQIVITRPA